MDLEKTRVACCNILARVKCEKDDDVWVIFDEEKEKIAQILFNQTTSIGANPYLLKVPSPAKGNLARRFSNYLSGLIKNEPTILLISHAMYKTGGIMEVIGRPDLGISDVSERFFCDWTMPKDSFVRVYSADPAKIKSYRRMLLHHLAGKRSIRITTDAGTDVAFEARQWMWSEDEVFTAPVETSATGLIVYDSSLFWARPEIPVTVTVEKGKIKDVECSDTESGQYRAFLVNCNKDGGASVLAECGLGTNPNAHADGHGMEAEQAQGTCHFDFGNNIPFGGSNRNSVHHGGTIAKPTIWANGREIMVQGTPVVGK